MLYRGASLRILQLHSQVFARCGSQFCYQKGFLSFSPQLPRARLFRLAQRGFPICFILRSYARRQAGIAAKKKGTCYLSIRPSVRTYQLGFHWTDFCEIWYRRLLLKYIKNPPLIKIEQNIKHCTLTPKCFSFFNVLHTYEHILKL